MRLVALVAIAACGSRTPPAPSASAPPEARPAPPAPVPAPVTCGDVGVILRGVVDDAHHAGPAKEAVIARSCLADRWSPEVTACIASTPRPRSCLDRLTDEQRERHQARLVAWNDIYGDESLDDPSEDDEVIEDPHVDCATGIGDVATYAPAITATGAERDFAVAMRRRAVLALCERWPQDPRRCFADGKPAATCRAQLDATAQHALTDTLARHELAKSRTAQTMARAGTFECKHVVARHYGDAAWKGKLDHLKPADRRRTITDTRALMSKACTDEQWTPLLRACLAGGGGADPCFLAGAQAPQRWSYPPAGVHSSGITECDEYGAEVSRVGHCDKIPQAARDELLQSYNQAAAAWTTIPADQRHAIASSCRIARDAIRQAIAALACGP